LFGLEIGGGSIPAGNFKNYLPIDMRNVFLPNEEMRLVRFSMGKTSRDFLEIPGLTINLDHNVIIEMVRVTISSSGNTAYGTISGGPTDAILPIDPTGGGSKFVTYPNNGPHGNTSSSTPDPAALWRTSFQIRRGFKKRWSWQSGLRMGVDPITGFREALVMRVAYFRSSALVSNVQFEMAFATSPSDTANN